MSELGLQFNPSPTGPLVKAAAAGGGHRERGERGKRGAEARGRGEDRQSARCFTEVELQFNPSLKGHGLGYRRRRQVGSVDGVRHHADRGTTRDPRIASHVSQQEEV